MRRMRLYLYSQIIFAVLLGFKVAAADLPGPEFFDVFAAGKESFASIRIPSVTVGKSGTVLAIAEGRAAWADQAENKIILKRSLDGGKTWGPLQIIADGGRNSLNNPCTVVDQQTGRIFVVFQSYPFGLTETNGGIRPGLKGNRIVRNCLITSDDDGMTWSKIRDITSTTKRAEATTMASGPGVGIELQHGLHAGRIIIPFNEGLFGRWDVLAAFSDDNGKSWRMGEPAPGCCGTNSDGKIFCLVNEVQVAELDDGAVMLNGRNWKGDAFRKKSVSRDGGFTWSVITDEPALPDPGCMGSIFRAKENDGRSVLLFSGPDGPDRENGTMHASHDGGKTWPVKKILVPGSYGYSVLTQLANGEIGCLFEADNANRIVFARFPLLWLETKSH